MKKWFLASLAVLVMASCEEEHGLDNDFMVFTDYDKTVQFGDFETFYIPDNILYVGYSNSSEYIEDESAFQIINMYADNMEERGYKRVDNKEEADLGIQLTLVGDTHHFISYVDTPYWWLGYSGYWSPMYWGNWGYWYYSYPVHYSYSTGMLIADMVNLTAAQGEDEKLPVVWNSSISGISSGSKYIDTQLALRGISQSFGQSGYLKKN